MILYPILKTFINVKTAISVLPIAVFQFFKIYSQ